MPERGKGEGGSGEKEDSSLWGGGEEEHPGVPGEMAEA